MLAGDHNLITAAGRITKLGLSVVVIKKGESGSIIHRKNGDLFVLPAYPATVVKDPTGAGDSFAGGFMGYLAGQNKTDFATLKKAAAYGTVIASFTIADFSLKGLKNAGRRNIDSRLGKLNRVLKF